MRRSAITGVGVVATATEESPRPDDAAGVVGCGVETAGTVGGAGTTGGVSGATSSAGGGFWVERGSEGVWVAAVGTVDRPPVTGPVLEEDWDVDVPAGPDGPDS